MLQATKGVSQSHLHSGIFFNFLDPTASEEENDVTFRSNLLKLTMEQLRLESDTDQLIREYYFLVFRRNRYEPLDWVEHLNKIGKMLYYIHY